MNGIAKMMTRKDFQELADTVAAYKLTGDQWGAEWWAKHLAQLSKRSNPAFKRDVFYRACGLEEMADN